MVARGDAARHLHVDEAVPDAVAADEFALDRRERGPRHRHVDLDFRERPLETVEVPALVDRMAADHLADLVDAVGELVAAILDMHRRIPVSDIASVDIGPAWHGRDTPHD